MKNFTSLFKEDPLHRDLRKAGLLTDPLTAPTIANTLELFHSKANDSLEENFLKVIIK
jgi:hypothetical protein